MMKKHRNENNAYAKKVEKHKANEGRRNSLKVAKAFIKLFIPGYREGLLYNFMHKVRRCMLEHYGDEFKGSKIPTKSLKWMQDFYDKHHKALDPQGRYFTSQWAQ